MNDVFFKPSQKIDSFFPDDFSVDSENFLAFIKAYYEWLQTTRITITNVSGTFQKNERIDGQVSRAHGIIQEVGNGYLVISVKSSLRFSVSEIIVGATSGAIANIERIKDNTVRATGNLLEYRDIEKSIDDYVEYLREELFPTIPTKYIQDKKLLATKLKTFFESRSSEESYRFFFKLLYGENIEFRFPGEEILRASDGKFERTNFIRVVPNGNIFDFLNKTIRGETSNAFGTVVDIKRFFFGTTEIAEFTLKLVSGTFLPNETIVDVLDPSLTTTTFGMLTGFNIVDGGSGYTPGDQILISGDGNNAVATVSSVTQASISALTVNEIGHGYRLNTPAVINNSGTGGSNLAILVTGITNTYSVTNGSNTYTVGEISRLSIINRGQDYFRSPIITIEDSTIAAIGLLSDKLIEIDDAGTDYGVGNTLVFTGGSGANAAGQVASVVESVTYDFLLEDDSRIVIDGSFEDILKDEDWDVIGPIRRIELTNFGDGYTVNDLPTITVNTTTGSGANLIAFNIQGKSANVSVDTSNNVTGVGSIRAIDIESPGLNYTSATADASISGDGNANLIPIITGLSVKDGEFLNDDGKIGIRVLIDSFFFQDFSYVIKSGLPFSTYRDELRKIIHPAGLQPFGEILISSTITLPSDLSTTRTIIVEDELDLSVDASLIIDIADMSISYESLIIVATSDVSAVATSELKVTSQSEELLSASADRTLNIEIEKFILSEFDITERTFNIVVETEADVNVTFEPQSTITKYKQIQGTVSSNSNVEFKDLQLNAFANLEISSFSSVTFEDFASLVEGNGTIFTTDFAVDDIFLANNEYFTVKAIFDDTLMLADRDPVSPYTDVFAYKVIP
jgi:hypothetical protein